MTYNSKDDWAKAQGYDDFADYKDYSDLPSGDGIETILDRANTLVNNAYSGTSTDATTDTDFLETWEVIVANRIVANTRARDSGKAPVYKYLLTEEEKREIAHRNDDHFNSSDIRVI